MKTNLAMECIKAYTAIIDYMLEYLCMILFMVRILIGGIQQGHVLYTTSE
jgi:hypothetical protein